MTKPKTTPESDTPALENQGAGPALARAGKVEHDLYVSWQDVQKSYEDYAKKPNPDAETLVAFGKAAKQSFDMYYAASKGLLSYEKGVTEAKRTGGEMISLEKAQKDTTQLLRYIYLGSDQFLQNVAQEAIHCKKPEDFRAMADETYWSTVRKSLDIGIREYRIPAWMGLIVEDVL